MTDPIDLHDDDDTETPDEDVPDEWQPGTPVLTDDPDKDVPGTPADEE